MKAELPTLQKGLFPFFPLPRAKVKKLKNVKYQ